MGKVDVHSLSKKEDETNHNNISLSNMQLPNKPGWNVEVESTKNITIGK